MARLIYASNMSLDGFTEDADGGFNWAPPDDEVFVSITRVMASVGTYLYGRRMYEVLAPWETDPSLASHSPMHAAYATAWQAASKIVYSSVLSEPITRNTTIERSFDPDVVRKMKESSGHDLLVGGPTLAAQAFDADLVDEVILYLWPIILGGRKPAVSSTRRHDLVLEREHRFGNGVIRLHYHRG